MKKYGQKALSLIVAAGLLAGCGSGRPVTDDPNETGCGMRPKEKETEWVAETAKPELRNQDRLKPAGTTASTQPMGDTLHKVLDSHDSFADGIAEFNVRAERRDRDSWESNLSAAEEKALLDSMNASFKEAVLKEAIRRCCVEDSLNRRSIMIAAALRDGFVPEELLNEYLIAQNMYAENYASELLDKIEPYLDSYIKDHPELEAEVNERDYFSASVGTNSLGSTAKGVMNMAPQAMYSVEADVAEEAGAVMDMMPEIWGPDMAEEAWNTAEYREIDENRFKSAALSPLSTFSIDTNTAGYTKLKYDIIDGYPIEKDEVKIEEMINYFNFSYDDGIRNEEEPFIISTNYTACPWNQDHNILRIGIKADDLIEKPATNFVLVTDVSGSMMIINKLPLALSAYADMLDNLDDNDTISLIYYASGNGIVLDNVKCGDKDRIYAGLADVLFNAGGGTNGSLGLTTAYDLAKKGFIENGVNRVLIATDGDFNIGRTSEGEVKSIVEKGRKEGIYLCLLGFGAENLKDNKMEVMAKYGNGNYHYIGDMADAWKALVQEADSTLIPVADDVKIQVEFNPAMVSEYRLIGYENRLLNAEDFKDDSVNAGDIGAGKAVTALYEIIPAGTGEEGSGQAMRYSQTVSTGDTDELCTVSIRYKGINSEKTGEASRLTEKAVNAADLTDIPDMNTALAISVAELGMVLRDSEYKGTASLTSAMKIADAVYEENGNWMAKEHADLIRKLISQSR